MNDIQRLYRDITVQTGATRVNITTHMQRREIMTAGTRNVMYMRGSITVEIDIEYPYGYAGYNDVHLTFNHQDLEYVMNNEHVYDWFLRTFLESYKRQNMTCEFYRGLIPSEVTSPIVTVDELTDNYQID